MGVSGGKVGRRVGISAWALVRVGVGECAQAYCVDRARAQLSRKCLRQPSLRRNACRKEWVCKCAPRAWAATTCQWERKSELLTSFACSACSLPYSGVSSTITGCREWRVCVCFRVHVRMGVDVSAKTHICEPARVREHVCSYFHVLMKVGLRLCV